MKWNLNAFRKSTFSRGHDFGERDVLALQKKGKSFVIGVL